MLYKWLQADETATGDAGWAANLAIFRVVYLCTAILPVAFNTVRWTRNTMPLFPVRAWQPVSFYQWIPDELLRNVGLAHGLAWLDLCLLTIGLLGFCTRPTLGVAAILSTYLFGLPQNFGKIDHFHHDVWFIAMLAAGPSGELISVDAVFKAIRRANRGDVELKVSNHAALLTLRYVWLLIGVLYFSSGIGKVNAALHSHWLDAASLQNIIRREWIVRRLYGSHFSLPFRYDELPARLIQLAGVGTIIFEMTAVGLVLFRGSRWLVILCGLVFHLSIGKILGIWFVSLMIAYVSMVDWSWLGRVAMTRAGFTPLTIIYDDTCDLCRRVIAILNTLDICQALAPVAARTFSDLAYPEVTSGMLARDLVVLRDDRVAAGYDGYREIAKAMPLLWPLALVMSFSAAAAIGRRYYRHVDDNRHSRLRKGAGRSTPQVPAARKSVRLMTQVVGMLLLAGEATTVALNTGHGLGVMTRALGVQSSAQALATWKKVRWVWPFDQYPTFAYSWDGFYRTWEPRLVYADGSESTIPPAVFDRAFNGHLSVAEQNVQEAIKYSDPVWRAKHALTLTSTLWKIIPESAKNNVIEIRAYDSVFSTNPDEIQPKSRKLVDTFPVQLLQTDLP